jgi:hypothetical protein
MRELSYEVIRYEDGWGIVLADRINGSFPTQQDAFDAAVQLARSMRMGGYPVVMRVKYPPSETQMHTRPGRQ